MTKKIAILNGPNLNLLGKREVDIYGNQSFEEYFAFLKAKYGTIELQYFQSNIEGELVSAIQNFGFSGFEIVINPAAYSHTSIAIADALAAIPTRAVEVHISNIFSRESYREFSFVSAKVVGVISGLGLFGYAAAIDYLLQKKD